MLVGDGWKKGCEARTEKRLCVSSHGIVIAGSTSKPILEVSSTGGSSEQQAASYKVYCQAESVIPSTIALYSYFK